MKIKLILWIIVMVSLVSFVSAELNDGLIWVFNYQDTPNSTVGNINIASTERDISYLATERCKKGKCAALTSANSFINYSTNSKFLLNYTNWTMSFWVNSSNFTVDDNFLFNKYQDGSNFWAFKTNFSTAGGSDFRIAKPTATIDMRGNISVNGDWHNHVIVKDGNQLIYYIDGNIQRNTTISTTQTLNQTGDFGIGTLGGILANGLAMISNIDEFYGWNRPLPPTEVLNLNKTFYPFEGSNTLNISSGSIPNNTQYNFPSGIFNFNISVNASYSFNCSFYFNSSYTQQLNLSSGNNIWVNFTKTLTSSGTYNYSINCVDNTTSANTTTNIFYYDSVIPRISTDFVNRGYSLHSNITAWVNFSDDFILYSTNITIDNQKIINWTNNIGIQTFNYSINYYLTNLTNGNHNLHVRVADGHTASIIGEYNIKQGILGLKDTLTYEMNEKVQISSELKDSSILDVWTTKKERDRYTQTLIPSTPSNTIIIIEKTTSPITIVNDVTGKYKQQYIIFDKYWKDYVIEKEPESIVNIKLLDSYTAEVTISNIKNNPNEIKFSSIGELNIVETDYPFTINASYVNVTLKEIGTNNLLDNFSVITELGVYNSSTNNYLLIEVANGTKGWNITKNNYYNQSTTFSMAYAEVKQVEITNWYAINYTFKRKDNQEIITPTCVVDSLIYSTYDYHIHKTNSSIQCSLFGYETINTPSLYVYPNNTWANMTPVSLNIVFTGLTDGTIATEQELYFFNSTNISVYQYNLSSGIVTLTFHNDGTGKYQQVYKYYNDLNTTINESIMLQDVDLVQPLKITGNSQTLEDARVCLKTGNDANVDTWMTTYCDYTDNSGSLNVLVNDQNTYLICIEADGYTEDCVIKYIPPSNTATIVIDITSTTSDEGFSYATTSCASTYNNTKSCLLTINTYDYNNDIKINYTRVGSISTTSVVHTNGSKQYLIYYTLNSSYLNSSIDVSVNDYLIGTIYHSYWINNITRDISFRAGNNNGYTIRERIKDSVPLYIAMHIIFTLLAVLSGYVIEKYYNGYGIMGAGIFFLFLGIWGFYLFYVPTAMIALYYIVEKVLPIIDN